MSPRWRAQIQDEQQSFLWLWNCHTIAHARGSHMHPYPTPSSIWRRANTPENEDEDFSDLGLNNFVLSHKSLLERGTFHMMEGVEEYNGVVETSIGYTSCIGMMLAKEITLTNNSVGVVLLSTRALEERIGVMSEVIEGLTTNLCRLKRSHEAFKIQMELELANRDLVIGVLRARVNLFTLMEVDLTGEEEVEEVVLGHSSPNAHRHKQG
ncbi:hypothetical protein BDM02DRAFT_3191346 [Thelephora ganbajun]|uniref:Uncharacterized protein n=1 Tax=Thelephora ganbajun TaxID=370292 RepID=A0ACB6Z229_THEGA|nr:hypothetical protein BDM02DRAFT_3191346 [Thelephora ganbajun]